MNTFLGYNDGPAFERLNPLGRAPILLVCENASNRLPERLGTLGLTRDILDDHIAWDIGAGALTGRLSDLMDAPAILQRFSRLVYNCSGPSDALDVVPRVHQGRTIPDNQDVGRGELVFRRQAIYEPFHTAITTGLNAISRRSPNSALISIRSFSDEVTAGDLDIGIICDADFRLAGALYAIFCHDGTYQVALNRPDGAEDVVTHTLKRHGVERCLLNIIITVRSNLIRDAAGQDVMARYLASAVSEAMRVTAASHSDTPLKKRCPSDTA